MDLLHELGKKVLELRHARRISRETLARKAAMSPRFLAEVESGRGNISITRLADLCAALDVSLSALIAELPHANPRPITVALIGLRGAGKTTIGKKLAASLRCPFVELDDLIEMQAGITLPNLFEVHGEEYYRSLEYEVLRNFLQKKKKAVLATGGGIVTRSETYEMLRKHCWTVWLKAEPQDHWNRVLAQDPRPMRNYPNAFAQLQEILQRRNSLYSLAHFAVDTSRTRVETATRKIFSQLKILQAPVDGYSTSGSAERGNSLA